MHKVWGIFDLMMQQMQLVMFTENLAMLGGTPRPRHPGRAPQIKSRPCGRLGTT